MFAHYLLWSGLSIGRGVDKHKTLLVPYKVKFRTLTRTSKPESADKKCFKFREKTIKFLDTNYRDFETLNVVCKE